MPTPPGPGRSAPAPPSPPRLTAGVGRPDPGADPGVAGVAPSPRTAAPRRAPTPADPELSALGRAPERPSLSTRPRGSQPDGAASEPPPAAAADSGPPHGQGPRPSTPDFQLAGYLLARQVAGRPVQMPAKALLTRANDSKKDVLQWMQHGRANVTTDLQACGNAGFHRLLAQRHVVGSTSSLGESPVTANARDAGLAAHIGSGNCGEFALVAAHAHAGRLQPGERLAIHKADGFDHSWVSIEGPASPGGTVPRAVLDVWADGPVLEHADGYFTDPARGSAIPQHTIEHRDAATASLQFEQTRIDPGLRVRQRLEGLVAAFTSSGREPTGNVYDPMTVVSSTFAEQARQALRAQDDPLALKRAAAELLREAAHLPGAARDSEVQRVIDMAARLDAVHDRHLSAPAAKRQRTLPRDEP
jgi:hypothetical protein